MTNKDPNKYNEDNPNVADYLRMDDNEKNDTVQRAVLKLKMRVHEILALLESGMKNDKIVHKKEEKNE